MLYKDVFVNGFFPDTAKFWNSLPVEYFRSTYDLNGLTLEVIDTFYLWFLFNHFSYMLFIFSSFVFLYSGLVVAFQPCMEWIRILKKFKVSRAWLHEELVLLSLVAEVVTRRHSVIKAFLKVSQNSQENTCARVSILIKLPVWGLQLS